MNTRLTVLYLCLSVMAAADPDPHYDYPDYSYEDDTGTTFFPGTSGTRAPSSLLEDFVNLNSSVKLALETMLNETKENFTAIEDANRITMYFESKPFKDKRYLASRHEAPFSLHWANTMCKMEGGCLVELDNREEYDFVSHFLLKETRLRVFRVGANDVRREGEFVNYNSGRAFNSSGLPWWKNNPDNDSGNENCVEIITNLDKINDVKCNALTRFVCEVPA